MALQKTISDDEYESMFDEWQAGLTTKQDEPTTKQDGTTTKREASVLTETPHELVEVVSSQEYDPDSFVIDYKLQAYRRLQYELYKVLPCFEESYMDYATQVKFREFFFEVSNATKKLEEIYQSFQGETDERDDCDKMSEPDINFWMEDIDD
jgi:hypothetical protein